MHSIATTAPSLPGTLAVPMPAAVSLARQAPPLAAPRILGTALLIMGLLLLNVAGNVGAWAFFIILAGMVFVSPEAAFKSLAICYLGLLLNVFFVPKSLVWAPGRIVLPALALVRFSLDVAAYRLPVFSRSSFAGLLVFCASMALCSIVSGWYTHIALLKITYFLIFMSLIFSVTAVIRHRRKDLGEWVVSLILAAAFFGVVAVALNVDQNFRTYRTSGWNPTYGAFFNGAFSHPNVHSIYGPLFVTFLAIVWLLSTYRQRWIVLPILACWAVFIAWSSSRTALLSCVWAAALIVYFAKPLRGRFGLVLRPRLGRFGLVGIFVVAVVAGLFYDAATGSSLQRALQTFIMKQELQEGGYGKQVTVEGILSSRKGLIDFSWHNFMQNKAFGIGFGVAKTEAFERGATLLTAPVEKGFLPTAILEEGGVFGAAAFVIFLGMFMWDLRRQRNVAGLIMFWVFLITNLGEVSIFSPGGAGAFGWLMVGAAMILNDQCWTGLATRMPMPTEPREWRP